MKVPQMPRMWMCMVADSREASQPLVTPSYGGVSACASAAACGAPALPSPFRPDRAPPGSRGPPMPTTAAQNNPLLQAWDTPYGLPPFDRVQPAHYLPAFEQ